MARAPNFGFEKRKKEQDRKAKTEAKREERRLRRLERANGGDAEGVPVEDEAATPESTDTGER